MSKYNPEEMRRWADWYEDKNPDSGPPKRWGNDPGHADLLRDHATAIEQLEANAVEIESLQQDLNALHDLFRKTTGYTAQEYVLMREEIRDTVSEKP